MCLQIHCDLPHGSEVVSSFGMRADLGETSIVLLPPELPDEGIEGGREHEAEAGHAYHPEQYGCSQRLPHLCTGTGCDRKRGDAQDERQRGHQDRAEPRPCGMHRGFPGSAPLLFLLPRELDDQNRVLGSEANKHNEADLRKDIDRHTPHEQPRDGGEQAHWYDQDNSERQFPAFILRNENEENKQRGGAEDE